MILTEAQEDNMARYTRDEMLQKLKELSAKDTVYKVEVDDAKYYLSSVYDAAKDAVREEFTHAGKWESLSEAERVIDMPYALQHLFGKTFLKSVEVAKKAAGGTTPYIDAIGHMVSELSPLNTMMQALIKRQVKGRRPAETTKVVVGTRTQLRATCPWCFRDHAVNNGRMVAHGYTLAHGYQSGNCSGRGHLHFGTESGRDLAASVATTLTEQAAKNDAAAGRLRAGDTTVAVLDRKTYKIVENPTQPQMNREAAILENTAYGQRSHARFLAKMVAEWQPKEPREVEIEITE